MTIIDDALKALFSKHRIFCSEADFQFSLAWEIQKLCKEKDQVWLEYTPKELVDNKAIHIDIVVFLQKNAEDKAKIIPIELKYKTEQLCGEKDGKQINLKKQSAQDTGRFDFIKDIHRMEEYIKSSGDNIQTAYAIFLTNDPQYWEEGKRRTNDEEFRIHEGARITGQRKWSEKASAGSKGDRADNIEISGEYTIKWNIYQPTFNLEIDAENKKPEKIYDEFRYTKVEIRKEDCKC